jgi:hypothetical protein
MIFVSFAFIYFLKYETIVRRSAWSFGHSDPDPSSVILLQKAFSVNFHIFLEFNLAQNVQFVLENYYDQAQSNALQQNTSWLY